MVIKMRVVSVIVGVAALIAFPSAAAASATTSTLVNEQFALSCPTKTLCYSLAGQGGDVVVQTIKGNKLTRAQRIHGAENLTSLSCPTAGFCLAVGTASKNDDGLLVEISHGVPGKHAIVNWLPAFVSCPSAKHCVLVGTRSLADSGTIEAGVASGIKVTATSKNSLSEGVSGGSVTIGGLGCASISACELIGQTISDAEFVDSVGARGKLGTAHVTNLSALNAVSCPARQKTCYFAAGQPLPNGGAVQPALYSVPIGGAHPTLVYGWEVATPDFPDEAGSVSCFTSSVCTVMGPTESPSTVSIVTFTAGKPGSPQEFPATALPAGSENTGATMAVMTSASTWSAITDTGNGGRKTLFIQGTTS